MRDWRSRLGKLVRSAEDLPKPFSEYFEARPSSGLGWPKGLPSNPSFAAFYGLCDGGRFYPYEIYGLDAIGEATESAREWADELDDEAGVVAGQWLVFGEHSEIGSHSLVWDAAGDRVGLFSVDDGWNFEAGGGWPFIPCSLADFWGALFFPRPGSRDEVGRAWHQAMERLDRLV